MARQLQRITIRMAIMDARPAMAFVENYNEAARLATEQVDAMSDAEVVATLEAGGYYWDNAQVGWFWKK